MEAATTTGTETASASVKASGTATGTAASAMETATATTASVGTATTAASSKGPIRHKNKAGENSTHDQRFNKTESAHMASFPSSAAAHFSIEERAVTRSRLSSYCRSVVASFFPCKELRSCGKLPQSRDAVRVPNCRQAALHLLNALFSMCQAGPENLTPAVIHSNRWPNSTRVVVFGHELQLGISLLG